MSRRPTIECPECGSHNYQIISDDDGVALCNDCDEYFDFEVDDRVQRRHRWDDDE